MKCYFVYFTTKMLRRPFGLKLKEYNLKAPKMSGGCYFLGKVGLLETHVLFKA